MLPGLYDSLKKEENMKTLKSIFPFFVIITSIGCSSSVHNNRSDLQDTKIEYLSTFAKLYGYIKYFHPSDEASSIDWNKFLYYGIEQVGRTKNPSDLLDTLESLFLPIAPSINIFFEGAAPTAFNQPEKKDDLVLVTWQHKGVAADPNPIYNSIRLRRIDWAYNSSLGVFQQSSNNFDFQNRRFKLSANVKTSINGKGEIEIFGYAPSSGKYYQRSGTFENEESEPFTIEDKFDEGISYLVLTIRLLEKGEILIDDLEFQLGNSAGHLQPFSISNNQFITEGQGEIEDRWKSYAIGYKYTITKSAKKTSIVLQSSDEFKYNSLFKKHCMGNESITKDLGNGIKCSFPLALYLNREKPIIFSKSYMNLKNKLDQIQLETNSAKLEVTRIGAVITIWNIIQHFYPYFDVVHVNWENILKQTLLEIRYDKDESDFLISLHRMTAVLNDGHIKITHPSEGNLKVLPIIFDYLEGEIIVVATNSDQLQKGDIILELDRKSAQTLLFNYEKIVSGSPQWKRFKALRDFTKADSNKISVAKIRRGRKILEVAISRDLPLPQHKRPDNVSEIKENIFYINLCQANTEEIKNRIQDISKAKGVVFDLRGYPNNNNDAISYLIDYPIHSAKFNIPEIIYPDHENIAGYDTSGRWTIEPKQPRIKGKIVFITNKSAISYSESIMGIIEFYKLAEIVGSQTAGANGNVNLVTTIGGFKFQWTGMKVIKHDDTQHHLVGIKPTIPLEPTISGIREGRDELLEKAIEIVLK